MPPGSYRITGYETRQVVDIDIRTFVTEWRAEVIEHQNGKRYAALIEELQPSGSLILFGYSSGGNLAFEIAKDLERSDRIVSDLILLDSWKRLPNEPVTENMHEWID